MFWFSDSQSQSSAPTSSTATVTSQQGSSKQAKESSPKVLKQKSLFELEIPEQQAQAPSVVRKKSEECESPTKPVVSILKKDATASENKTSPFPKENKPVLKKEPSFEKQSQSVVTTSLHVTPAVKTTAKQDSASVSKITRKFKLQKSKTLGEMPSELNSEKVSEAEKKKGSEGAKTTRPILRKAKTFDSGTEEMDPELASLLKSRRRGSADEVEEER